MDQTDKKIKKKFWLYSYLLVNTLAIFEWSVNWTQVMLETFIWLCIITLEMWYHEMQCK